MLFLKASAVLIPMSPLRFVSVAAANLASDSFNRSGLLWSYPSSSFRLLPVSAALPFLRTSRPWLPNEAMDLKSTLHFSLCGISSCLATFGLSHLESHVVHRGNKYSHIRNSVSSNLRKIFSHEADLGEFCAKRLLPQRAQRMIVPYIFLDHMGPAQFSAGQGIDVRPHPHIGLATITCLLEGSILHRDSLGCLQEIVPGDINLMVAGRGITHSERETEAIRNSSHRLDGLQLWLALPDGKEEIEPSFTHHSRQELPEISNQAHQIRVLLGSAFGLQSPIKLMWPMLFAHVHQDQILALPTGIFELGVYVLQGKACIGEEEINPLEMGIPLENASEIRMEKGTELVILGRAVFSTPRYIDWNFVSCSKGRLKQAKEDWKSGKFPPVPGESEFIPYPDFSSRNEAQE